MIFSCRSKQSSDRAMARAQRGKSAVGRKLGVILGVQKRTQTASIFQQKCLLKRCFCIYHGSLLRVTLGR